MGNRSLQRRISDNIVFNDADIKILVGISKTDRTTAGSLVVTFNKSLDIIANYGIGTNANIFKKTTSNSISKTFNINEDNNGSGNGLKDEDFPNNFFYLSIFDITSITISQTSNGIWKTELQIFTNFPNLVNYTSSINQSPDFTFLSSLPGITNLDFAVSVTNGWAAGLTSLKNSNLKALTLRSYNSVNPPLMQNLPATLYYFKCTQLEGLQVDLKDYFTGNRVAFVSMGNSAGGPVNRLTYSGGAVFPSVLTENVQAVDYLLYQSTNTPNKLTSDQFSQFIIDMANQVTAVNLTTKRITVQGTSPNTSYTDNTKPIYQTYTAARNYLIGTLGIVITTS
ncbi:hypothetical protein [Epilithonimonas caeni]|uniref:hypothetical protein n=1 Tax=Epilithonimonas caeni TaxID=365343 RepID=UPI000484F42C|nr:hypothetical protein [Epilithonimonas caeni]